MTSDPTPDRNDSDPERPADNSPLLEPTPEEGDEPDKDNVGASTPDEV